MKFQHQTVDVTNDTEAYFNQFGKFALLIGATPEFSSVSMDIGLALVHSALINKTYCLYLDAAGKPTAGLMWAYLDEEAKAFYFKYGILSGPDAWRSGNELWLLNVVAPNGQIKDIFKDTMETLFRHEKEAFMIRPSPSGRRRVVRITHKGAEVVRVLPKQRPPEDGD